MKTDRSKRFYSARFKPYDPNARSPRANATAARMSLAYLFSQEDFSLLTDDSYIDDDPYYFSRADLSTLAADSYIDTPYFFDQGGLSSLAVDLCPQPVNHSIADTGGLTSAPPSSLRKVCNLLDAVNRGFAIKEGQLEVLEFCQRCINETRDSFGGSEPCNTREATRRLLEIVKANRAAQNRQLEIEVVYSDRYMYFLLRVRRSGFSSVAVDAWPDNAQAVKLDDHFTYSYKTRRANASVLSQLHDSDAHAAPRRWGARRQMWLNYVAAPLGPAQQNAAAKQ